MTAPAHRFEPAGSGTRLVDEVRCALPVFLPGPLAAAVHRWQVGSMLQQIFDYRQEQYRRLFGGRRLSTHPRRRIQPRSKTE